MKLFFDASATVAILAEEPDVAELSRKAEDYEVFLMSAMSKWETLPGLCRSYGFTPQDARDQLDALIAEYEVAIVPLGEREGELALDAYQRFGKGRHPAALNMGDCFSYACAKANDARLLYKGQDFDRTDMAWPNA